MRAPTPRGPLGETVHDYLTRPGLRALGLPDHWPVSTDEDRALALWTLYELSYRGFDDVDDALEWDPALLALRGRLEQDLERRLRRAWTAWDGPRDLPGIVDHDLSGGEGTSSFVRRRATADDVRAILVQKSVYHLKESDPHGFVLPRLEPGPKAALAELQYDELGNGDPGRLHAHLFAQALEAAGLDPTYGAYVDQATEATLTLNNAMSLFCLHRRLRHAAMGHLAAFEATSSLPSADMVRGLRRLGFDEAVVRYYDEHVEADAVHEHLAARDICGRMTGGDPALEDEVGFGAFTCVDLEARSAAELVPAEAAA
ncbi:MAG: iron-containing redox enzyme family protein [Aeromicrobium erythreum]